ncbi:MAG: PQQ-binding-like beta-propeller repeat protein [Tepidisphaeraceae bacterium]
MLGDRLLDQHPDLADARPLLAARTSLAWHLAGEPQRAQARAQALRAEAPNATAELGGQSVKLADWTADQLKLEVAGVRNVALDPSSWPVAFGSPARDRVADIPSDGSRQRPIAPIYTFDYQLQAGPQQPGVETNGQVDADTLAAALTGRNGSTTGVLPVVDRGELFFQDNTGIYALNLMTGQPLAGWVASNGTALNGRFGVEGISTPPAAQMGLAVTDKLVIGILGQVAQTQPNFNNGINAATGTFIVAVDRTTGKQVWRAESEALKALGDDANSLTATRPIGTPLVVHDSIYVVMRGSRNMQFDDVYLVCLNLDNGRPRWARHLVSANSSMQGWQYGIINQPPPSSHIACSDGRVYVSTDAGALACVDAIDGALEWLSVYPRPLPQTDARMRFGSGEAELDRPDPAFNGNPVMVHDGRVYSVPADAKHLFVHDALSGKELARLSLHELSNASVLLGIADDRLIVTGGQWVHCIGLAKLLAGATATEATLWKRQLWREPERSEQIILGRGAMTRETVYIPYEYGLVRMRLTDDEVLDIYPRSGSWAKRDDEGPGNVLVIGDTIVIAGPTKLAVYTEPAILKQRLEATIAQDPTNPEPRLRFAESMFLAGDYAETLRRLDEAIALLRDSAGALKPGTERTTAFTSALSFARKLRELPADGAGDLDTQRTLFDRAQSLAQTPSEKLSTAVVRAGFEKNRADVARELAIWQSILDDADQRGMRVRGANKAEAIAEEIARERIGSIVARSGAALYAPIEQRANEALEAALTANDPAALIDLTHRFPNSQAAAKAVAQAGAALAAAAKPAEQRMLMLHQLAAIPKAAPPEQRIASLESLARAYHAAHDEAAAEGLLRSIIRLSGAHPTPLRQQMDIGGKSVADPVVAADALRAATLADASDILSDVRFAPVSEEQTQVLNERGRVVVPNIASILSTVELEPRADRIVAMATDGSLKAFAPGDATPVASVSLRNLMSSADYVWLDADRLAVRSDETLSVVNVTGQRLEWEVDLASIPKTTQDADTGGVIEDDQLQIESGTPAPVAAANPSPVQAEAVEVQMRMAQQRAVLRNGRRVRGQVAVPNAVALTGSVEQNWQADPPRNEKSAETFTQLRFARASGRLIVGTSHGRVIAFSQNGPKPLWQRAAADRAVASLAVAGDFVAGISTDERASRMFAYNVVDGSLAATNRFDDPASGGASPMSPQAHVVNFRLTPQGVALVMTTDRLIAYDLAVDPRRPLWTAAVPSVTGALPLTQSSSPDQLVVVGDRVLVLTDVRTTLQNVRVLRLDDGQPVQVADPRSEGAKLPLTLAPHAGADPALMYTVGERVYVLGTRTMVSVDPTHPERTGWERQAASEGMETVAAFATKASMVVADTPAGRGAKAPADVMLSFYSRASAGDGVESGLLEGVHTIRFNKPTRTRSWQATSNGFAYAGNNDEMVMLPVK